MNILLINADQLRHDCVGYRNLRPVKTPNLNALARESVVYESAFTPLPVCSPARQALLCGRRPDAIGAQWNYDFMPTPELDPAICWPRELKERGWNTGYIGRFHVSPTRQPADFGYTDYVPLKNYRQMIAEKYPSVQYTGGWLGCESPIPFQDSESHWMSDRACDLIQKYAESGNKWHLWVDFEIPHLPVRPSKPYSQMYDPKGIEPWDGWGDEFINKPYIHKQQTLSWNTADLTWDDFAPMVARYYGWISQLDDAIGRIITALKKSGQYENTVIFFTSDHGDMCASHSMLDKHYVLYDDIIRIPLLMRVPGVKARTTDEFVMNCLDIPQSIRRYTGLPEDRAYHGKALPENEKEDSLTDKDVLVTSNGQQFGLYTTRALRTKTHKYVWNLTDIDEFYDLENDPGEKNNLIGKSEFSEMISSFRRRLYDRLTETGDRFVKNEWIQRQLLEDRIYLPDRIK